MVVEVISAKSTRFFELQKGKSYKDRKGLKINNNNSNIPVKSLLIDTNTLLRKLDRLKTELTGIFLGVYGSKDTENCHYEDVVYYYTLDKIDLTILEGAVETTLNKLARGIVLDVQLDRYTHLINILPPDLLVDVTLRGVSEDYKDIKLTMTLEDYKKYVRLHGMFKELDDLVSQYTVVRDELNYTGVASKAVYSVSKGYTGCYSMKATIHTNDGYHMKQAIAGLEYFVESNNITVIHTTIEGKEYTAEYVIPQDKLGEMEEEIKVLLNKPQQARTQLIMTLELLDDMNKFETGYIKKV